MARWPFLVELVHMPWWVGIAAAAFLAAIGAVVIPGIALENPYLSALRPVAVGFAWVFAFLCILAGVASFIRSWREGRLFAKLGRGRSLESLSWQEFEAMLAGAFRAQGYQVLTNPPGPDGGIDLRLRKDGKRTYVQAKHWRNRKVGVRPVRELAGVVTTAGVEAGIVVSSIGFTREARQFAASAGIELVGPEQLHRWFHKQGSSPRPETPEEPVDAPLCRQCQVPMVRRVARRGPQTGSAFWGCANYPQCRVTMVIEAPIPARKSQA